MKKFFFFLLILCVLFAAVKGRRIYSYLTGGFTIEKITGHLPIPYREDFRMNHESTSEASKILNQKFHYIGHGGHFFAFASEDEKYVIKFIKQKYKGKEIPAEIRDVRIKQLESYGLSYLLLREETGLLWLHFYKTDFEILPKSLILVDGIGRNYPINPNEMQFVIQKKAELLIPYLDHLAKNRHDDEIQEALQKVILLLTARNQKGIADGDASFVKNIGFLPDLRTPIFIDAGSFYKEDQMLTPTGSSSDIQKRFQRLIKVLKEEQKDSLVEKVKAILEDFQQT